MRATPSLDRRRFLQVLGGLSLPVWFPRMTFGAPRRSGQSDVLVCIFQRGGADGLNVVVPFGESAYYDARPQIAIAEPSAQNGQAARDLDGFFGLHPALAPLHELFQDGALALVHAVGSPDETRSHFDAMDYMERGTPGEKIVGTGWINRHLQTAPTGNDSPFRAVSIGPRVPQSLRGPVAATALQSIADFHLQAPSGEVERFQQTIASLYDGDDLLSIQGQQTLGAIEQLATSSPGSYQPQNGAVYPESELGFGLQQVAQMIRAELGLEVACLDVGGWDTHEGQGGAEGRQAGLLADVGASLQAFYQDLDDRMSGVTMVGMSEFGRRLAENAGGGTDHGRANVMWTLGGGVEGGRVYGAWPGLAEGQLVPPGDLAVTTDFRTVLAELVQARLRNDRVEEVFPGFDAASPLGLYRALGTRRPVVSRSA